MKYLTTVTFALLLFTGTSLKAQVGGNFKVKGDLDKFYPVTFVDGGRYSLESTQLELGREVHTDSLWRGSLVAIFRFRVNGWGAGANFITADIRQNVKNTATFIAGWRDASYTGAFAKIIVWLRGNTSYYYHSNYAVSPTQYDGVNNPLPLQEPGGPAHSFKTAIDNYVNPSGFTSGNTFRYTDPNGTSYIGGKLGIGTLSTNEYKLAVEGTIGARKVKVTSAPWADFVFEEDYQLPTLKELEKFISENKHLPGIPTTAEVKQNGIELGEISKKLL
ncbi:MAG: hypothetical protein ACTHLD_17505, partial [Chitinophaga sp.]